MNDSTGRQAIHLRHLGTGEGVMVEYPTYAADVAAPELEKNSGGVYAIGSLRPPQFNASVVHAPSVSQRWSLGVAA